MKKFLIFITITLLLSACSFFQKKEEVPTTNPAEAALEKKIGLVSLSTDEGLLVAPSNFLLISDAGEKTFVASLYVNLKRYLKRRVEVEGRFDTETNVFSVENVISLGNETLIKSVYESKTLGLKLQYPSVWVLKELKNALNERQIQITPYEVSDEELEQVDRIIITRTENNKRLSVREWLNLDEEYRSKDPLETNTIYQQSSISATSLDAVKKSVSDGSRIDFYVSRDTFIYILSHATQNDSDKDLFRNAFYSLVSGFEFIPFEKPAQSSSVTKEIVTIAPKKPSLSEIGAEELAKRKQEELQKTLDAETAAKEDALKKARQVFIDYITSNIFELSGEPQQMAIGMKILEIAFAHPEGKPEAWNAIYVTYRFGNPEKKMVLQVFDATKPETMKRAGVYERGETVDWKLLDGEDPAKGSEKTLISLISDPTPLTILKGMTPLDAKAFKIKIQYPSNMYWRYIDDKYSGATYHFSFKSNLPLEASTYVLYKNPENLPETMKSTQDINGKPASFGVIAESEIICMQLREKYCIGAGSETPDGTPNDANIKMLGSIQEY